MRNHLEVAALVAAMTELAMVRPRDPDGDYLLRAGWVPLGAEAFTGIEGWGNVIDGRPVAVPKSEALTTQHGADDKRSL